MGILNTLWKLTPFGSFKSGEAYGEKLANNIGFIKEANESQAKREAEIAAEKAAKKTKSEADIEIEKKKAKDAEKALSGSSYNIRNR